jgi:hypothetical protein
MVLLEKYKKNIFTDSLDYRWFEKYKRAASFQDYEYLISSRNWIVKQKELFLKDKIENPTLNYPKLDKINFGSQLKKLSSLKKTISKHEPNRLVKDVYIQKINEKIIELKMLEATRNNDDNLFLKYSKLLYGIPKKEIFLYTISQIHEMVKDKQESTHSPFDLLMKKYQFETNKKRINLIRKAALIAERPPILVVDNKKGTFEADKIRKAFKKALKEMGIHGFNVVIDAKGEYKDISVDQKNNIIIPRNRKASKRKLVSLINHEIGVHVQRKKNGEDSGLKLLSLGLDHYLKGEEGLAAYVGQRLAGFNDYSGLNGYFAVSLALGLDGEKRNFRDVFEILKDYYLLIISKKSDGREKRAKDLAWARSVRIFRGTTCKTPGACFTKDIVYREGNIGVWNVIRSNPKEEKRFFVGKYDPANRRHTLILDQLGII